MWFYEGSLFSTLFTITSSLVVKWRSRVNQGLKLILFVTDLLKTFNYASNILLVAMFSAYGFDIKAFKFV